MVRSIILIMTTNRSTAIFLPDCCDHTGTMSSKQPLPTHATWLLSDALI